MNFIISFSFIFVKYSSIIKFEKKKLYALNLNQKMITSFQISNRVLTTPLVALQQQGFQARMKCTTRHDDHDSNEITTIYVDINRLRSKSFTKRRTGNICFNPIVPKSRCSSNASRASGEVYKDKGGPLANTTKDNVIYGTIRIQQNEGNTYV